MQKLLVIQTAFIGDAILATGIIEKLHASFPDAAIDFLVRKGNETLLNGHPFLREVLVWNKKEGKLKNLSRLLLEIRKRRYDKVINVQRFAATGILTAFSGAGETIGFDKNPLSFLFSVKKEHIISTPQHPKHEMERNNDLIAHFTNGTPCRPKLYPSAYDREQVKQYKGSSYISISPASIWFTKQYPAQKWVSFISRLPAHYALYLLGGTEDVELCQIIANSSGKRTVMNLAGKLSFLQSCALMKDAVMNYVNDSAPMHLASAVNAPVTAVYCSTLPSFGFGPLSDRSHIVEIEEPLACRPCGLHGHKACPLNHFNCAGKIKEEQLLATLPADSRPV
ncbi:MAG: glycosyltransferase family 9 protein [Chitinophagaceae bacterium]|nr:glycosyltransferase family 9 protein [Chitinophagaceae bacterium]